MREVLIVHNGHRITAESQYLCLRSLTVAGLFGATSQEIEHETGLDHGAISGALSTLHKKGLLALLKGKRNKFKVYVLPEHVGGREVVERVSYKARAEEEARIRAEVERQLADLLSAVKATSHEAQLEVQAELINILLLTRT